MVDYFVYRQLASKLVLHHLSVKKHATLGAGVIHVNMEDVSVLCLIGSISAHPCVLLRVYQFGQGNILQQRCRTPTLWADVAPRRGSFKRTRVYHFQKTNTPIAGRPFYSRPKKRYIPPTGLEPATNWV